MSNLTGTDVNKLTGITNGTQAAGKCVVADSNVNTGVAKVTGLHIGTSGSETEVTATPAEINLLDTAVAGTVVNSKAVIYSAAGQVAATTVASAGNVSGTSITNSGYISTMGGASVYIRKVTLADNASISLSSDALVGFGEVLIGANQEWAQFRFGQSGATALIVNSTNVTTTIGTDGNLNIGANGSDILTIENMLDSELILIVNITYYEL